MIFNGPVYPSLGTAVGAGFGIFSRVGGYAIQIIVAAIGLGILIVGAAYLWALLRRWLVASGAGDGVEEWGDDREWDDLEWDDAEEEGLD